MSTMTARSPRAFALSALLHGAIIALLLLFTYAARDRAPEVAKTFQLVAGAGDNFAATEAPALGVPGGIKLKIPEPPAPLPEPPAPAEVAPSPPAQRAPEPVAATPAAPKETKMPDLKRQLAVTAMKKQLNLEAKARREKDAADRKAKDEELKRQRQNYEDWKKQQTGKTPATTRDPKIAKVDAKGIAKGVLGGSTANETGGAGGTALTREDGSAMDAYMAMLRERVLRELERPSGVDDNLVTDVFVANGADGSLSRARVVKSSGSAEFDRAVLEAIGRVRMPARPDRRGEELTLRFRAKDVNGG